MDANERIKQCLYKIYGQTGVDKIYPEIWRKIQAFQHASRSATISTQSKNGMTEQDIVLITYPDQFRERNIPPLQTLKKFLDEHLTDSISGVHILPFYPYSSDDGFSVIDYRQVAPKLGTWQDIDLLAENFQLMFDLIINHISAKSEWFQKFLSGEKPYTDYFIVFDPDTDLSTVVRPRSTPLLTRFQTSRGPLHVWTTFSTDQIDLDYHNPRVLLEMIDVLLFYVKHGASIIRLDAIAYLWKTHGTSCIHLPQTHAVVKLFRALLDWVAPAVILITETNVPHHENISYFGQYQPDLRRSDEAQLVYQFPLAPLLLHAFLTADASYLTEWMESLIELPPGMTFFNFTASHDGVGVRPAEGLLQPGEVEKLIEATRAHGGQVSYRSNPDGSQSAYELNITWFDALNDPANPQPDLDIRRFLASQAIMLSLAGVPGIYVHSLFGSRNCLACVEETGRARSINREKFVLRELEKELSNPDSLKSRLLAGYRHLLRIRKEQPAFHPDAGQRMLDLGSEVFATMRIAGDNTRIVCLTNVTPTAVELKIDRSIPDFTESVNWIDLISGEEFQMRDQLQLGLEPYQYRWLKKNKMSVSQK